MPGELTRDDAIAFHLVVPRTAIQRFGFAIDPVALLLGVSVAAILSEVLAPVLTGPARVVAPNGVDHDVFPVELPVDVGVTIPLGKYSKGRFNGSVGVYNVEGALMLHVPDAVKLAVEQGLRREIDAGRARFVGYAAPKEGGHQALFEVRPGAGTEWTIDLFGKVKLGFVFG